MISTKKEDDAIMECYRRLYANSTPSADFDQLFEEAEINEFGQKKIDFNSYEIEQKTFEQILNDIVKEYKIKYKWRQQAFKNTITLGVSPKFKIDKKNKN